MTELEEFLRHNVEEYLFGDLRLMQGYPLGYPPLLSTFAGIELLGGLLHPRPFSRGTKGAVYFKHYWTKYLYPSVPENESTGRAVYQLARHGIAHGFFPKGPIGVGGPDLSLHLRRDANGLVIIHPTQLGNDFIKSYEERVEPRITQKTDAPNAETMGKQLRIMLRLADADARRHQLTVIFPQAAQPGFYGRSGVTSSINVGMAWDDGPTGLR